MPLPNLEKIVPIFDVVVPSTEKSIKMRPFLVKEEKLLLIALAGDDHSMHEAVSQIVSSCAISPVKVSSLANFDLDYLFIQLRANSVNEFVELAYKCHNETELSSDEIKRRMSSVRFKKQVEALDEGQPVIGSCDNIVKIRLDLRDVKVQINPAHTKTIFLTDAMGLTMKYPGIDVTRMLNESQKNKETTLGTDIENTIKTVAMCDESVFDGENVYSNFLLKEITEWIEKLTQQQFAKIQEFFETMPKLVHDLPFQCDKCNFQQTIHLEGLTDFFG